MHKQARVLLVTATLLLSQSLMGCAVVGARLREVSRRKSEENKVVEFKINRHAAVDTSTQSDNAAYLKYYAEVSSYLRREEFDKLDDLAADYRAKKSRFSGGAWKIHNFYIALSEPREDPFLRDASFEAHLETLKKWVAAKPDSITARVALANGYLEYGWFARGNGYADKVGPASWRQFDLRVALAKQTLVEAKGLKEKDPYWYVAMLRVATSEGWDVPEYDRLFEEAISYEPSYEYFYSLKAIYVLPRWHGQPGDWERFVTDISERQGKQGSIIYYVVSAEIWKLYRDKTFFVENDVSWTKVKQGFADMVAEYGSSMRDINRFAEMAVHAEDWPFANKLFREIGDNWDQPTWKRRERFENYRDTAKR
jgi:hypothetical protein